MNLLSLFEMDWYDKSPLVAVLKANRGRWIHFSAGAPNRDARSVKTLPEPIKPTYWTVASNKRYQRDLLRWQRQNALGKVPKIGVNPRSFWRDPKGVYFYPCDWLLSGVERIRQAQQHGLSYRDYYLADINLNDPAGINLKTVTWDQITEIARRNGWLDMMVEFRKLPIEEQKRLLFSYSTPDLPGSFLWHFVDRNVKDGKLTWLKAFGGISFILDPNLAIIHSNEPSQLLVLNPKVISNMTLGSPNKAIDFSNRENIEHWMHALMSIIKAVRGEFGGSLTWAKKKPTLRFEKGRGKFELSISTRSDEMEPGLHMTYTYGRAEGSLTIKREDLESKTSEQIVDSLNTKVNFIAQLRSDLLFKPIISIPEAMTEISREISGLPDLNFSTVIYNSESRDQRWSSANVYGTKQREVERMAIETRVAMTLYPQRRSIMVEAKLGNAGLLYASPMDDDVSLDQLADAAIQSFDRSYAAYHHSKVASAYRTNNLFSNDEDQFACAGWIIKNCGLSLGGRLQSHYAAQIAAFEAYPNKDRLLDELRWVMAKRW